jgi:hypothetical protein
MKKNSWIVVLLVTAFVCLVAPGDTAVAQYNGVASLGVHRLPKQIVIYGDMSDDDDCYQCYKIYLRQNQLLFADIDAADLGSCLDAILEVWLYPELNLLLENDDAINTLDSELAFKAPRTGYYLLCVREFDDCEFCWDKDTLYQSYADGAYYSWCFPELDVAPSPTSVEGETKSDGVKTKAISRTKCKGVKSKAISEKLSDARIYVEHCWYFLNYGIHTKRRPVSINPSVR